MNLCPCGSGETYSKCCERLHCGKLKAETAEQLMRARYSAYSTKNVDYLIKTHNKSNQTKNLKNELILFTQKTQWLRLEILETIAGSKNDKNGYVRFSAYYNENGRNSKLEEFSFFKKKNGQWIYISGE